MIRLVFDLIYLYRMYPVMEIAQTMTQQNGNCASLCKITFCRICEQKERFFIWLRKKEKKERQQHCRRSEIIGGERQSKTVANSQQSRQEVVPRQ